MKTSEIKFSKAALENIQETGADVDDDVKRMYRGETPAHLLERCLDGADQDRVQGWRDYVSALVEYLN